MVTFTGPHKQFSTLGLLFKRGEPRPVPPEVAAALAGHPWFEVTGEDAPPPAPAKRGRPRKS